VTERNIGPSFAATAVLAVHVLALLVGGGLGLAHDRGTLRAERGGAALATHHLGELHAVHRVVGGALATSLASGAVLFFLHAERYVTSAVFWIKMALVVGLAANAMVMQIAERDIAEGESAAATGWTRLRGTARASTTLWILVALAGVAVGRM